MAPPHIYNEQTQHLIYPDQSLTNARTRSEFLHPSRRSNKPKRGKKQGAEPGGLDLQLHPMATIPRSTPGQAEGPVRRQKKKHGLARRIALATLERVFFREPKQPMNPRLFGPRRQPETSRRNLALEQGRLHHRARDVEGNLAQHRIRRKPVGSGLAIGRMNLKQRYGVRGLNMRAESESRFDALAVLFAFGVLLAVLLVAFLKFLGATRSFFLVVVVVGAFVVGRVDGARAGMRRAAVSFLE